jgi:tripartite-type tricarboxylate transporter receptor subunit TctC
MQRFMSFAGALLAAACASLVHAQAWPTKSVKWIVPFPPGAASDITARVVSERLAALWGQGVVVENKPGAGGTIATAEMLKSPADGYTLMSGTMGTHAIAPNLYKALSYEPARDIVPVTMMVDVPLVLVASTKVAPNTLKEFLALAKEQPGKLAYASPGNGTLNHIMGELFKQSAKVDMAHIPYKGSSFVYPDMYSGAVALMFDPILGASTQVKQGRLKAYAISASKRSPALPDVPTMAELGFGGFDATLWLGFFAPAGTPAPIVAKVSADLVKVLAQPDVKQKLEDLGGEIVALPHEQFAPRYRSDVARWGKTIRELGIRLD